MGKRSLTKDIINYCKENKVKPTRENLFKVKRKMQLRAYKKRKRK